MVLVPYTTENCKGGQTSKINEDMIIQTIAKAKMILDYIKDSISWTDKGEMVIWGEVYPYSSFSEIYCDRIW